MGVKAQKRELLLPMAKARNLLRLWAFMAEGKRFELL